MTERRQELSERLEAVHARIERACAEVGRDPDAVTLVVVTKHFPMEDLARLVALGVKDIGENKDQEAAAKLAALAGADSAARAALRVHFIGQLQTNKAGSVAGYADVVHSVDRPRLVEALDRGAQRAGRQVEVLIQVSLDDAEGRGGAAVAEVPRLAEQIAGRSALRLGGVMAVAPLGADPDAAFARLAEVSQALRREHQDAWMVSAGMSADLEAAVRHGATHLRVGGAILGSRLRNG